MDDVNRKCRICDELFISEEDAAGHDPDICQRKARSIDNVTMKPMLADVLREALILAAIDSSFAPEIDEDGACWIGAYETFEEWNDATEELKRQWRSNPYKIPLERIDIEALAQNLAVRMFGSGGWTVAGGYTGNMNPRQVFDATFDRPDRDQLAEFAMDMGLKPSDKPGPDGIPMFEFQEDEDE